jgi:hypothetical protein
MKKKSVDLLDIEDKYRKEIELHGWDLPDIALAQCVEACAHMIELFPELNLKKGLVHSQDNIDNPNDEYPRQYQHCWLETEDGTIVDPTIMQYINISPIVYKEFGEVSEMRKCYGCGMFHTKASVYCGECRWSDDGFRR